MPISPDSVLTRSPEPVETTVGNEIVLMTLSAGECYGLGDTGSDIWRHLALPITLSELLAELREEYDAPEGVLEADTLALLEDLETRRLILVG